MTDQNPVWWSDAKTGAAHELCKNTAPLPHDLASVHEEPNAAEAIQQLIAALDDAVQNIERLRNNLDSGEAS